MTADDLDGLRERFPGWEFGVQWITAASGPDRRQIVARRGAVTLSAWTADGMAEAIEHLDWPG